MTHIGKKAIKLNKNIQVIINPQDITVKGPLGSTFLTYKNIIVSHDTINQTLDVRLKSVSKKTYALWGMYRTLIAQMVTGVTQGYNTKLELIGVGYKARLINPRNLELKLGYSKDIIYPIPEDVTIECIRPTLITVSGIDKQRVNQVSADIRAFRSPEPYKGKGVRYVGEKIKLKEGKKK
jgi:large subunit ribosomal protein L6